jgi:RNA-directed DNA polymerase
MPHRYRIAQPPAGGRNTPRGAESFNPIVCGWVNYFRIGHASRCFAYVRDWVEKKVRRHLMRARNRRGFGWKRWSRVWLYDVLGLFAEYRVQHLGRV